MILSIRQYKILLCLLFLVFICSPFYSQAASLYLEPAGEEIYRDNSFLVNLKIDSQGQEINALDLSLDYSPSTLELLDVLKGNSIIKLWAEEPVIDQDQLRLVGGIPNGFLGDEGMLASLIFRARQEGAGTAGFNNNSQVLLNDGQGTPARLILGQGNYDIVSKPTDLPQISSKSHPSQEQWYQAKTLHLHWDFLDEAQYSYRLSHSPLVIPDTVADYPEGDLIWMGDMEYKDLDQGIYYFHLRQALRDESGHWQWGPKTTFRAMIDFEPPTITAFKVSTIEDKHYLSFAGQDSVSDIDYYKIKEKTWRSLLGWQDEGWRIVESPYLLRDQDLSSIVYLKAVDEAGNETVVTMEPSQRFNWSDLIIVALILTVIYCLRLFRTRRKKMK